MSYNFNPNFGKHLTSQKDNYKNIKRRGDENPYSNPDVREMNNNYNNSDYELYGFYGNILFKYYYITNILWYLGFIFMSIYLTVYILSCSHRKELYNDIAFFKYVKINTITLAYNIILKCSYGIFIFLLTATQNNKTNYNITLYYNYIIIDICMFMLVNEIIKIILSRLNKII